jgi:hypothetical protein
VIIAFEAALWRWDARQADSWVFVSLPAEASERIRDQVGPRPGFGSVRVRASIGGSSWSTSIFPDSARHSYVLPLKKAVRKAEGLTEGDVAAVTVEVLG